MLHFQLFGMDSVKRYFFIVFWIYVSSNCFEAKDAIKCDLAAFIENIDGSESLLIDSGSVNVQLSSCDEESQKQCITVIEEQVIEGTSNGNFSVTADEKEAYTIGDMLCDKADAVQENVRNKMVQIYWRLCGSNWKRTSFRMPKPLCCEDGLYVPCEKLS